MIIGSFDVEGVCMGSWDVSILSRSAPVGVGLLHPDKTNSNKTDKKNQKDNFLFNDVSLIIKKIKNGNSM